MDEMHGYMEEFKVEEARFGSGLLWMRLKVGKNRHIPLSHVRWFSVSRRVTSSLKRATDPSATNTDIQKLYGLKNQEFENL